MQYGKAKEVYIWIPSSDYFHGDISSVEALDSDGKLDSSKPMDDTMVTTHGQSTRRKACISL
jgi:hypothetical protein